MLDLLPFQKKFLAAALRDDIDIAALSLPRGNGKSALAGHLVTRILTPSDKLFRESTESVLCAASIEQARTVFRFARADLEPTGEYRFLDSATRVAITHKSTKTRLRVIGSNGKTAMGLVNCPWAICDEPGAWEAVGGELMRDAIFTALGKPESPMKILLIGTLAPAIGKWWPDLVKTGSSDGIHVTAISADPQKWMHKREIARCNPLMWKFEKSRKTLMRELAEAKNDSSKRARFKSYRLNLPSENEIRALLTPEMWQLTVARTAPERAGRYVLGVDLGHNRAWSAAVAIWENGRVEAMALAPGIPSIADQERRDTVSAGTYQRLVDAGQLSVAAGLRVPEPQLLVSMCNAAWGTPTHVTCDRFKLATLSDAAPLWNINPRAMMPSECNEDILALRKLVLDGPLAIARESLALVSASIEVAMVETDKQANVKMVKRGSNNQARDDVAAALALAAGEYVRAQRNLKLVQAMTRGGAL